MADAYPIAVREATLADPTTVAPAAAGARMTIGHILQADSGTSIAVRGKFKGSAASYAAPFRGRRGAVRARFASRSGP
ncbi:hypothetical protein GCM10027575_55510 [Phytohabitans suffuscus]